MSCVQIVPSRPILLRIGAVAARLAHNQKAGGASPSSASKVSSVPLSHACNSTYLMKAAKRFWSRGNVRDGCA